jgi:hypothetical protein
MLSKLRKLTVVVTVALVGFSGAQAVASVIAPFDIEFRAATPNKHSVTRPYSFGSVRLSAFASYSIADGAGDLRYISRANSGWGVIDPSGMSFSEAGRMGGGETLQIDFGDRDITLTSLSFSTFDAANTTDDDNIVQRFDVYVRALGSTDFVKALSNYAANGAGGEVSENLVDLSGESGLVGSVFMLVSLNDGIGSQGFRMSALAGTAVVPLPGTAAALGGGLLMGAVVLRRRRKKAA